MRKAVTALLVLVGVCALPFGALANNTYQTLPFSQDWTNTGLITTNNDWSGVPGIEGFLGDITTSNNTSVDPQTILDDVSFTVSPPATFVFANVTTVPSSFGSGGPVEFDALVNPTVAMQGSGSADAPHLKIYLNTTGMQNIRVQYDLRDIDCQTFVPGNGQPFALHYRVGTSGSYTNVSGGFVADAGGGASGAGQCSKVTHVDVTLPAAANNVSQLQLRIMTTNAVGTDEEIGVDNISITGDALVLTGACCLRNTTPGACIVSTQVDCATQGGIYLGDGVPCDAGTCATPVTKSTWGQIKTLYR